MQGDSWGFLRFPETSQSSATVKSQLVIMGGAEMKYALFGNDCYNVCLHYCIHGVMSVGY